jgi:hypothetical protein
MNDSQNNKEQSSKKKSIKAEKIRKPTWRDNKKVGKVSQDTLE